MNSFGIGDGNDRSQTVLAGWQGGDIATKQQSWQGILNGVEISARRLSKGHTVRIVYAEEYLLHGGLGSAVAMSAARQPMRFVGLKDTLANSGSPEGLLEEYGLTAKHIVGGATQEVMV